MRTPSGKSTSFSRPWKAFQPKQRPNPRSRRALPPRGGSRRCRRIHLAGGADSALVSPPPLRLALSYASVASQDNGAIAARISCDSLLGGSSCPLDNARPTQTAKIQAPFGRHAEREPATCPTTGKASVNIREVHITGEPK